MNKMPAAFDLDHVTICAILLTALRSFLRQFSLAFTSVTSALEAFLNGMP